MANPAAAARFSLLLLALGAFSGCIRELEDLTGASDGKTSTVESQANLEEAVAILQSQAHGDDAAVRANCMEAVQVYHDRRSWAILEQGLHDPIWVVRFAAAMAAGQQKAVELKPALVQLSNTETNDSVRVALIFALKRMGDTTNMSYLARTMKSSDSVVRANTAMVLGLLGDPSAIAVLDPAKRDPDLNSKIQITAALARLGDKEAQDVILALSVNLYAEEIYTAITTASDLKRPEVDNVLLQGLNIREQAKKWPSPPTEQQRVIIERCTLLAARGLGKRGDVRAGKLVLELSKDKDASLRALSAFALGEMLYSSEEAPLVRLMKDPDTRVQVAAAAATLNVQSRALHSLTTQPH